MIVVVAALRFENQAERDQAVDLIREVQLATRVDEPGCHDYCFYVEKRRNYARTIFPPLSVTITGDPVDI